MDESIRKKRKCKRGYGEKLGENSPLQHFLPEKQKLSCFFTPTREGKASPEERGKAKRKSVEIELEESSPQSPHSVLVIELQHCGSRSWKLLFADGCCKPEKSALRWITKPASVVLSTSPGKKVFFVAKRNNRQKVNEFFIIISQLLCIPRSEISSVCNFSDELAGAS